MVIGRYSDGFTTQQSLLHALRSGRQYNFYILVMYRKKTLYNSQFILNSK